MNRLLTFALIVLLVFMPANCSAKADGYTNEATAVLERTAYVKFTPVVQLEIDIPGFDGITELPNQVIGSAWATRIDGDYRLVTAQHVVMSTLSMPGRFELCSYQHECVEVDRSQGVGPVLGVEPSQDWIYWEVSELPSGLKASKLHRPEVGEPVCVGGAPLGRPNEVTCGAVSNVIGPFAFIDARILPGNSGGPIFDDKNRVVGMVVAMDHPESQNVGPVPTSSISLVAIDLWL